MKVERSYIGMTVITRNGERLSVTKEFLGKGVDEDIITLSNKKTYKVSVSILSGFFTFEEEGLTDSIKEEIKEKEEERKSIVVTSYQEAITEFRGEYRFLSNFYNAIITYNGVTYHNVGAGFQGQKDLSRVNEFAELTNPVAAKRLGRKVSLRRDWEKVKLGIMLDLVRAKFTQHPELKEKLLSTGERPLIEGGRDNFWGNRNNHLGKILMQVRSELSGE